MSKRKNRIPYTPSCWNCCKLKKSKRVIDGDLQNDNSVSISAPSIIDAIAGYYCDNYWFGDKPDEEEMLCGGKESESVYR